MHSHPAHKCPIPDERIRHHGFFGRVDRFRGLSLVFPAQKPIHPRAEGEGKKNKNPENKPSALCFGMHGGIIARFLVCDSLVGAAARPRPFPNADMGTGHPQGAPVQKRIYISSTGRMMIRPYNPRSPTNIQFLRIKIKKNRTSSL